VDPRPDAGCGVGEDVMTGDVATVAPQQTDLSAGFGSVGRPRGWTDAEIWVRFRRGAGGTVRVDGVLCSAPVWFRWDGATLWQVASGAAPVGTDHVRLRVELDAGVTVAVRSVAATVIYAGQGSGTRWDTEIHVAEGARLDWRPEPVILTARARHQATTTMHAAAGADVTLDEVLVLGRGGETGGVLRSTLEVSLDGAAALCTSIDTSLPAWSGPAGVDGAAVVGNRLRLGADPGPRPPARSDACLLHHSARLEPAHGCQLAVAAADDVTAVQAGLSNALPA
jgi:urease accessory protein